MGRLQIYNWLGVVLIVLVGSVAQIASSKIPTWLESFLWLSWPLLGVLVILFLIVSFLREREEAKLKLITASKGPAVQGASIPQPLSYRIDKMKLKIKIGTAAAIVSYFTMFLYLISPEWVLDNISLIRAVGWVLAIAMASYLVIGDIHNWLDKNCFFEREGVDAYIRAQLTKPCREILCPRAVKAGILDREKRNILNLFYTFIPADNTERERAFSYFTDYFITVNLSALSVLGGIGAIIICIFTSLPRPDQRIVFGALSLLLPILFNLLRYRTRRKLCYPAEAQTARILNDDLSKLKESLPGYRIYENDMSCKDSTKCPFIIIIKKS